MKPALAVRSWMSTALTSVAAFASCPLIVCTPFSGIQITRSTGVFVGSEGVLGVITEITLRLYGKPESMVAATCAFDSLEGAVNTVIQTIQLGVPIARVELIDHNTVRMVNAHSKLGLREETMLLMEFHGSPAGVQEQAETVQDIATEFGGQAFEWATTPEDRTRLWTARHNAYFAAVQSRPGCRAISTDTCVPISRLADCLLDSVAEADASGLPYFLVGHVGDGNFHFGYLIDPDSADERRLAEDLNHKLVARALALEGTCTGEHGVGLHKMDFLRHEAGDGAGERAGGAEGEDTRARLGHAGGAGGGAVDVAVEGGVGADGQCARAAETDGTAGRAGAFEGETVTRRRFVNITGQTAGIVAAGAIVLPALGFAFGPPVVAALGDGQQGLLDPGILPEGHPDRLC